MNQAVVDVPHPVHTFFNKPFNRNIALSVPIMPSPISRSHPRYRSAFNENNCSAHLFLSPSPARKSVDQDEQSPVEGDAVSDGGQLPVFPHIRSLGNFPREELFRKVVMVRFDKMVVLEGLRKNQPLPANAFSTIKYLYESGAKVILVGSWDENINPIPHSKAHLSSEFVAEFLSSMLEVEVVPVKLVCGYVLLDMEDSTTPHICLLENLFHCKGERANSSKLSKELTSGVDIVINDAFSESHKVLASTVGVASFCYAYIAGFYFDEGLRKLKKIIKTSKGPYVAIIGGSSLVEKADAVHLLASICDGLVFVGSMTFQIMHALGIPVPMKLVEHEALKEAVRIVESAMLRNIPLGLPQDVWCIKENVPREMEIVSVHSIPEGWQPVDIGPGSLEKMISLLSKCKKILWIGPVRFSANLLDKGGTFKLAEALGTLNICDVTFVGKMEFDELVEKPKSFSDDNFLKSAAVVWEVLKGGKLPGLMALDREYPCLTDWSTSYDDPMRPLVVDVGSGNGMFLFEMAKGRKDMNFLGLEINRKLVDRCLDVTFQLGIHNLHFIAANATSTFRSIVASYPGELVLVSIQCPNPDFNRPQYRWRMLQRSLVEAVADMLVFGGKVFLQSDIEAVAVRMKDEFMEHGKGKLAFVNHSEHWLKENPFGVASDWEKHVLERGDPMYRLLLFKLGSRS